MNTIQQHLYDDALFILHSNESLYDAQIKIIHTGTLIGRVIFREWSPVVRILGGNNVIENVSLTSDGIGTFVEVRGESKQ
jgi:hypothetical protein